MSATVRFHMDGREDVGDTVAETDCCFLFEVNKRRLKKEQLLDTLHDFQSSETLDSTVALE